MTSDQYGLLCQTNAIKMMVDQLRQMENKSERVVQALQLLSEEHKALKQRMKEEFPFGGKDEPTKRA